MQKDRACVGILASCWRTIPLPVPALSTTVEKQLNNFNVVYTQQEDFVDSTDQFGGQDYVLYINQFEAIAAGIDITMYERCGVPIQS